MINKNSSTISEFFLYLFPGKVEVHATVPFMVHRIFLKLYSDNNWPNRIMHFIIYSLYDTFSNIIHATLNTKQKIAICNLLPKTTEITE